MIGAFTPRKATKRKKKITTIKIVDECKRCKKKLKANHKHHWFCNDCWKDRQLSKGNLSLIGGMK